MMLTGVEYCFWVYYKRHGREQAEYCFDKKDAEATAEALRAKGYTDIRIEQRIA